MVDFWIVGLCDNFQVKWAYFERMYFLIWVSLYIRLWCKRHLKSPKNSLEELSSGSSYVEFLVGWLLTIQNKNFRWCGTFLSQNWSCYTFRVNFLRKSFFDNFRFLNCGFVDFIGRILIYPNEYLLIGHIFGKYTYQSSFT